MSQRYGIKQSLLKLAIKYAAPRLEEPPPEHVCSPCEREHRLTEAGSYCKDCKEKLCLACLAHHRKFQILKTHDVVKVRDAFGETKQRPVTRLSETCSVHGSKLLNLYCPQHDDVGCVSCMAIEHTGCREPEYIVRASAGLHKTSLPKETRDGILQLKKELFLLKMKRMADKRRLVKEKDGIMTTVINLRKRLDEILDRLEGSAKEKLTSKFESDMKQTKHDIKNCEETTAELDELLKKMKLDHEPQLFIRIKTEAKESKMRSQDVVKAVSDNVGLERLNFTVDETLEKWLDNLIAFGKFDHDQPVFHGTFYGKFDASFEKDEIQDDYVLNGIVYLPDGRTVIGDWKNKKLKIFDDSFKPLGFLELPAAPYSLCCITTDEILVTLRDEKIIQFVSIGDNGKMAAGRKFKLDEYPRGIGHHEGEIYITCGGGIGEIHGQLRVYSMTGVLTRVYQDDVQGQRIFHAPKDIVINLEKTRIHVVDRKRGIITISTNGRVMSVFSDRKLRDPIGLTLDDRGNLFAVGAESNNVVQLTGDGTLVAEVLRGEEDGVRGPLAVACHLSVIPRLVLTMEGCREVHVFTLAEK